MKEKPLLRIKTLSIIFCCIIFALSSIVVFQARIINETKNSQTSEFFLKARVNRDLIYTTTLESLKDMINDTNVSGESRNKAAGEYINLILIASYESKIETALKSKGYKDVIVIISENKVMVVIGYHRNLKDKQMSQIHNIVEEIARINDVEIVLKK